MFSACAFLIFKLASRIQHFPLAVTLTLRNPPIMRQLLLSLALFGAGILLVPAQDSQALVTHSITVGQQGTLQIVTPGDWRFMQTNLAGAAPYVSLHSPSNSITIEASIFWDGISKKVSTPTRADFERIVSNVCVRGYARTSVEKKIVLEDLQGPSVSGTFARFTDARWVPMLKEDYPNIATGMFRCGNLWGNFDVLTYDRDGPLFKQALQVLESMRRVP